MAATHEFNAVIALMNVVCNVEVFDNMCVTTAVFGSCIHYVHNSQKINIMRLFYKTSTSKT